MSGDDDHLRAGGGKFTSERSTDAASPASHDHDSISYFHDGSASLRRTSTATFRHFNLVLPSHGAVQPRGPA